MASHPENQADLAAGAITELREDRVDPASPSMFAALQAALAAEGLPTSDLQESGRNFFAYFNDRQALTGFGGFEIHGEHALVRSIVVLPGHRGHGLVWSIVPLVLAQAAKVGARHAWLLTEDAAPVFKRMGFEQVDRQQVPDEISATRQYRQLCGESATLMHRPLERTLLSV